MPPLMQRTKTKKATEASAEDEVVAQDKMIAVPLKKIVRILHVNFDAFELVLISGVLGRGRENKENERNAEDGSSSNAPSGRDFRGRGDRNMNGPSRLGRGGRGSRGGRGPGGSRTFQSRDNNDRGGGFPRQIDTWNNPETENTASKAGKCNDGRKFGSISV